MTDDFILHNTMVKTAQLSGDDRRKILLSRGVMLRDVIVSNSSLSRVTLLFTDGEHTHIIAVIPAGMLWSHAFQGGWSNWKGSNLELVKEEFGGQVDVSVGYIVANVRDYSIWSGGDR